jgi:hypothetical protein
MRHQPCGTPLSGTTILRHPRVARCTSTLHDHHGKRLCRPASARLDPGQEAVCQERGVLALRLQRRPVLAEMRDHPIRKLAAALGVEPAVLMAEGNRS